MKTCTKLILFTLCIQFIHGWLYVPVSDLDMVRTSEAVIYGVVTEEVASLQPELAYRYFKVEVSEKITYKTNFNQTIVVRTMGGFDSAGIFYHFPGSPVLHVGENLLLFLKKDKTLPVYDILHFGLGIFHELADEESFAYRVSDDHLFKDSVQIRRMKDFILWIKAVANSQNLFESSSSYFSSLNPQEVGVLRRKQEVQTRYNTLMSGTTPVKWQTFTTGGTVNWYVNPSGAPALNGSGLVEIQQAFAAWNSATPAVKNVIKYNYAGSTTSSTGLSKSDNQNSLIYNDPNNEISGSYDCSTGGTLAIGGWKSRGQTFSWRGTSWYAISEADIVVQDGISCWVSSNSRASIDWANMITHEFGHTLSMGHSCGDTASGTCVSKSPADLAIMRAYLRSGVGAVLGEDDKEGINYLYASCYPNCNSTSSSSTTSSSTTAAVRATTGVATTGRSTTGRSTTGRSTTGRATTGSTTGRSTTAQVRQSTTTQSTTRSATTGSLSNPSSNDNEFVTTGLSVVPSPNSGTSASQTMNVSSTSSGQPSTSTSSNNETAVSSGQFLKSGICTLLILMFFFN